jgi:DNA-binding transcriptional regulator YdaS (Cro superfamily)
MAATIPRKKHPGIVRAIAVAGSQKALADTLGCTQSTISKRMYGDIPVTAEWAVAVEKALKGIVTREELRPDLFRRSAA